MSDRVVKTGVIDKNENFVKPNKETLERLKGKIIILNPEQSEIAKNLDVKEKGVYGIRFK